MQLTENRKRNLKKHAAAIHSAGQLTLVQRKICNALLYKAYPSLQTLDVHEISIRELVDIIGFSGNNHAVIKNSLKRLMSVVFEWNLMNDKTGEEDWTASTLLASVKISGAKCFYSYSHHLRELLYTPAVYANIDMQIQARFGSTYGLALYENCIRYRNLSATKWFDLTLFRKLMGVDSDKYTIFRDFKRRVIDVAVKEVNLFSDLAIEPEYEKNARAVSRIRFHLRETATPQQDNADMPIQGATAEVSSSYNPEILYMLCDKFGFTHEHAIRVCREYPESLLQEKIDLIRDSAAYENGSIKNLPGYFLSALKNDFKKGKAGRELNFEEKNNAYLEEMRQKAEKRTKEAQQQKYDAYTTDYIKKLLLTESRVIIIDAFALYLQAQGNPLWLKKYRETEFDSQVIWVLLKRFVIEQFSSLLLGMQSFEEFTQQHCFV